MATRSIKDAALIKTKALPAAGAANATDSIDLQKVDASFEGIEVEIAVPALPSLADTKTVTVTLKDSADNATFAAIAELATLVLTGAGGAGAAAASRVVRLPSSTRRYLRADIAVEAAGGDNTAKSATLSLLF
jgi:hypothetical protein